MSNDRIILTAGLILGTLDTLTPDLLRRAAQNSLGLDPSYRQALEELAKCHEAILIFKAKGGR